MLRPLLFIIFCLHILPGVRAANEDQIRRDADLLPPSQWEGETLFELIPSERSGVDMRYELDPEHPLRRLYAYGWATGNVAIGDLDGDGRADLFFPGTTGPHRLFLQRDDFSFEEATPTAQLGGDEGWGSCAVLGDVDNDGDLDIYVVNYDHPNQLLVNISSRGLVRFADMASDYKVDLETGGLAASFVDADNDGLLDLYVQTYHLEPEGGRPENIELTETDEEISLPEEWEQSYLGYRDREGKASWIEAPLKDRFFRNSGNGVFFPEPTSILGQRRSYSAAHTWWDFDHNLMPDLYVGNDSHMPDLLFRNQGSRKFVGVSTRSLPGSPWLTRGGAAADWNGDLLIDFFATGSSPRTWSDQLSYGEPFRPDLYRLATTGGVLQEPRNTLFANTGTTRFQELAHLAGLARTGATWASKAADYDLDGRPDLFLATGEARDWTSLPSSELIGESLIGKTRWEILSDQPKRAEPDLAFRNQGNWQFENASSEWGLDHVGMSYSASHGDLDGDGDLDLVVCALGEPVRIYRNHSQANRCVIRLEGTRTHSSGIGAELIADTGDLPQLQQLYPSGGFKNSDEPAFFLGLGNETSVRRLSIRWPGSGVTTTLQNLEAGKAYTITEAISLVPAAARRIKGQPLFSGSAILVGAGRLDRSFDDYTVQPLLPRGISRTGPSLAAIDIDRDGASELFIGGGKGAESQLIARSPVLGNMGTRLAEDREHVDGGAVFFDADNNGNLDLFVASGSVEAGNNESPAADRLYFGGAAGFQPGPGPIPGAEANSGPVAAADFDRDGDVDLFIGSRFEVGAYPKSGTHRLLINDGSGKFSDETDKLAPGLQKAGAATSAIWSDADGDGWLDLLIATHWGPVRFWKNSEGSFTEETQASGLSGLTGLWNSITGGDIDNDGDIDYLVGNEGLNTENRLANGSLALYLGDFLEIGKPQLVETFEEKGRIIPRQNWLDFAELKTDLLEEYSSSRDFQERGVPEIFSDEAYSRATRWTVNTLASGFLRNDGKAQFEFVPFPRIVQVAPVYGMVVTDVNADGHRDAYLLQNRASATIRQPAPDNGGVSQLLLNSGDADAPFLATSPEKSGLIVFGPARSLITTDLNNDNRPDFIATLQNDDPVTFLNESTSDLMQPIKVKLDTRGKHPAGARVTFTIPGSPVQTAEYYAGGGFLSQSPPELFFAAPAKPEDSATVSIRWADGTTTKRRIYFQ